MDELNPASASAEFDRRSNVWMTAWFMIWVRPRATIRRIVEADPNRFVIEIAWVAGALAALDLQMQSSSGQLPANVATLIPIDSFGSVGLAVFAFVCGLLSVATLYGLGQLYRWSGHLLGGSAKAAEVRAALAWAQVPAIYITTAGAIVALLTVQGGGDQPALWWKVVRGALGLWAFVISLKALGEVHRFSAWRALGSIIVGSLAVILAMLAIVLGLLLALIVARLMF